MTTSNIQYPNMRRELCEYLQALVKLSQTVSDATNPEIGMTTEFDFIIHFFYDDTSLAHDAPEYVGVILYNDLEASAIMSVSAELDLLMERHGCDLSDTECVGKPEWQAVVTAAASAHALICANTEPS